MIVPKFSLANQAASRCRTFEPSLGGKVSAAREDGRLVEKFGAVHAVDGVDGVAPLMALTVDTIL